MPTALGDFDVGQAPLLTATVAPLGVGTSTAVRWTIRDPNRTLVTYTEADAEVDNPATNVWTLQMDPLEDEGVYWIKCESTAGIISAKIADLGCIETPF